MKLQPSIKKILFSWYSSYQFSWVYLSKYKPLQGENVLHHINYNNPYQAYLSLNPLLGGYESLRSLCGGAYESSRGGGGRLSRLSWPRSGVLSWYLSYPPPPRPPDWYPPPPDKHTTTTVNNVVRAKIPPQN